MGLSRKRAEHQLQCDITLFLEASQNGPLNPRRRRFGSALLARSFDYWDCGCYVAVVLKVPGIKGPLRIHFLEREP